MQRSVRLTFPHILAHPRRHPHTLCDLCRGGRGRLFASVVVVDGAEVGVVLAEKQVDFLQLQ